MKPATPDGLQAETPQTIWDRIQMAVIIATLAIAARKRNLLWSLAAATGAAAIGFAVYVYLYV